MKNVYHLIILYISLTEPLSYKGLSLFMSILNQIMENINENRMCNLKRHL